ncbi:hypothetical protein ACOME3_000748 [Neoechinorhynchus agilis]
MRVVVTFYSGDKVLVPCQPEQSLGQVIENACRRYWKITSSTDYCQPDTNKMIARHLGCLLDLSDQVGHILKDGDVVSVNTMNTTHGSHKKQKSSFTSQLQNSLRLLRGENSRTGLYSRQVPSTSDEDQYDLIKTSTPIANNNDKVIIANSPTSSSAYYTGTSSGPESTPSPHLFSSDGNILLSTELLWPTSEEILKGAYESPTKRILLMNRMDCLNHYTFSIEIVNNESNVLVVSGCNYEMIGPNGQTALQLGDVIIAVDRCDQQGKNGERPIRVHYLRSGSSRTMVAKITTRVRRERSIGFGFQLVSENVDNIGWQNSDMKRLILSFTENPILSVIGKVTNQSSHLLPGDIILNFTPTDNLRQSARLSECCDFGQDVDLEVLRILDAQGHEIEGDEVYETFGFRIYLNDTKSAGLGISVKGASLECSDTLQNDGSDNSGLRQDLGLFVDAVIYGGAAHKDGRIKCDDQIVAIDSHRLDNIGNNREAMRRLRAYMEEVKSEVSHDRRQYLNITIRRKMKLSHGEQMIRVIEDKESGGGHHRKYFKLVCGSQNRVGIGNTLKSTNNDYDIIWFEKRSAGANRFVDKSHSSKKETQRYGKTDKC